MVLNMFETFIRSEESGISAGNKSLKCERLFIIKILMQYSCLVRNCSLLALRQCSKIVLVFLVGLFVSSCSIFYQYDRRQHRESGRAPLLLRPIGLIGLSCHLRL